MIKKEELSEILRNNYSRESFKRFYEFCMKYGVYLLYSNSSYSAISNMYELSDITTSLIGPMFERDDSGSFIRTQNYFYHLKKPFKELSDGECIYLLKALIRKVINQNISLVLEEIDSEYTKILRSVKKYVNSSDSLSLKNGSIIFGKCSGFPDESTVAVNDEDYEFIRSKFYAESNSQYSTPDLMKVLQSCVTNNSDSFNCMDINQVVLLIKEKRNVIKDDLSQVSNNNVESSIDNSFLLNRLKVWLSDFINKNYVLKKKLSESEASAIVNATMNYQSDFIIFGTTDINQNYLMKEISNLSGTDYNDKYRHVCEYIIRLAQKKVKDIYSECFQENIIK